MEGYDICSILLHGIMGFANHWRAKLWNHCPVFIGSYLIGNHIKFHYFLIWREKKHPQNCLFGKDIFTPKNPQIVGFCIYIFKIFMGGRACPPRPPWPTCTLKGDRARRIYRTSDWYLLLFIIHCVNFNTSDICYTFSCCHLIEFKKFFSSHFCMCPLPMPTVMRW